MPMSKLTVLFSLNTAFSLPRRRATLFSAVLVCLGVLAYIRFAVWSTPEPISTLTDADLELYVTEKDPLRILLVSALFPLQRSKHSLEEYVSWLQNFIGPAGVQSDIYFYTTPELESHVNSLHSSSSASAQKHRLTINTTYSSPFSIPPISPYTIKYHEMHAWDRERKRHNAELYAVWNAKPWLLQHAVSLSQEEYDYAFWVDAGSFRATHPFRQWPHSRRVKEMFGRGENPKDRDKMLVSLYGIPGWKEYAWRFEMGPVDMDMSEGAFFGSTSRGISWFSKTFYETHDWYINTAPPARSAFYSHSPPFHFVGKEQTLINTLLFRYPEQFIAMLSPSRVALLSPSSRPSPILSSSSPPTSTSTSSPSPSKYSESKPYILTLPSILTARLSRFFFRDKSCGDWFYYQWFLASSIERDEAQRMGWVGCRSGELVSMETILEGLFGRRWVEGRRAGGA